MEQYCCRCSSLRTPKCPTILRDFQGIMKHVDGDGAIDLGARGACIGEARKSGYSMYARQR